MTTSTINTSLPVSGSALDSSPVRSNFAAAASDIDNIYTAIGTPGTASQKAASDGSKATVASVSGAITAGHIAVYADTSGTVEDGGPVPSGGGGITALTGDVTASGTGSVAATVVKINGQTPGTLATLNSVNLTSQVSGTLPVASGGTGATAAGATAAGNIGALAVANNLSELTATSSTARTNLGLGTASILAAGSANGVATLDGSGKVPVGQIPSAITGGLKYQGLWNASTNSPSLSTGTGTQGFMYKVSVAGSTALDGISTWNVGDELFFDGTAWEKLDGVASEVLSVAGRTGAVVLTTTDISGLGTAAAQNVAAFAQTANNLSDLVSASAARTNLGLGTGATMTAGAANGLATLDTTTHLTSAQVPLFLGNGVIIGGIGDSMTAQSAYYNGTPNSNVPAWAPSTAYIVNNQVVNGVNVYRCTTAGTSASSGGPSGINPSTDGSVTWALCAPTSYKYGTSFLAWMEKFSSGVLYFDQSQGYSGANGGIIKGIVLNGGSNYSPGDTITFTGGIGATGTLTIVGGVITAVNITNPGITSSHVTYTITTSTGSGAVLSFPAIGSGTFATTGNSTSDMVAMLPDAIASKVAIFTALGGTNDMGLVIDWATCATVVANAIANLKTVYEGLMNAGKKVIAFPIMPRFGTTTFQVAGIARVNRWIKLYCQQNPLANPSGYTAIAFADPTGYWVDGTSVYTSTANAGNKPIGGAGAQVNTPNAMTQDGLHESPRGAQYMAIAGIAAAQKFTGPFPAYPTHDYSIADGYDLTNNIGGNIMEGLQWTASTPYIVGQTCANGGNIYRCTTAGNSASSGGPTGTGSGITDGTAVWTYNSVKSGMSVFSSGTGGTLSPATGVTLSGTLASGYTLQRVVGTATGTVGASIESPWSNGQIGQRQVLTYTLGSGAANENWSLYAFNNNLINLGILNSDLNSAYFEAFADIELSGIANLSTCYLSLVDTVGAVSIQDMNNTIGTGWTMMNSSGEMAAYPNNGRLLLHLQPMKLPSLTTALSLRLVAGFDASGGAGSATLTMKINFIGWRKAFVE